jgi:CrcB protein
MVYMTIAIGGAAGAVARYALDAWVSSRTSPEFPFGTLLVNLAGSFALGLLFALTVERAVLPPDLRAPAMIGFLGAFTTFSTWMLESWRLVESGAYLAATLNLGGSVLLGMVAVILGMLVGRAV